jgi:hypothetical protein
MALLNNVFKRDLYLGFQATIRTHGTLIPYTVKRRQSSLVVTLLGLRNAFGEVHHRLTNIPVVSKYHHMPERSVIQFDSLYRNVRTTVITDSYSTEFMHVKKGVLYKVIV